MGKVTKGKVAWHAANIFLPLSESARVLRAIKYSGSKLKERVSSFKRNRRKNSDDIISFDEAVSASGYSREVLISRYLTNKRIWLSLVVIATVISISIPIIGFSSGVFVSTVAICRALSMFFMLLGFGCLSFVKALVCQYRIWQLQTYELGSFADWKSTNHWFQDILSWKLD
ncbi:MAG: conjugal transfer protein TraX [Plesiomonas shigelloides]